MALLSRQRWITIVVAVVLCASLAPAILAQGDQEEGGAESADGRTAEASGGTRPQSAATGAGDGDGVKGGGDGGGGDGVKGGDDSVTGVGGGDAVKVGMSGAQELSGKKAKEDGEKDKKNVKPPRVSGVPELSPR